MGCKYEPIKKNDDGTAVASFISREGGLPRYNPGQMRVPNLMSEEIADMAAQRKIEQESLTNKLRAAAQARSGTSCTPMS